jgi:hypothetical protein
MELWGLDLLGSEHKVCLFYILASEAFYFVWVKQIEADEISYRARNDLELENSLSNCGPRTTDVPQLLGRWFAVVSQVVRSV